MWTELLRAARRWHALKIVFDPEFYLARYPDVRESRMNPRWHYILHGAQERRKPNALFDPEYYLNRCPQARRAATPWDHFAARRGNACASPHPLFDTAAYLRAHPEARTMNPLVHYLSQPLKPAPAGDPGHPCAPLNILDVPLDIVLSTALPKPETGPDARRAYVWRDSAGRIQCSALPQQGPFLRVMKLEQLLAQIREPARDEPAAPRAAEPA